jgi:hypothetical protein
MPVGTGKTWLTKKYPNLFVDHDDLNRNKQHHIDKLIRESNWDAVNAIHKNCSVPNGKILLTWSVNTVPDNCVYGGVICRSHKPHFEKLSNRRKEMALLNEVGVRMEDVVYDCANDIEVEHKALEIAKKILNNEIIDVSRVRDHNIESFFDVTFKDAVNYSAEDKNWTAGLYMPHMPSETLVENRDDVFDEIIPIQIIDFHEDNDLFDNARVIMPSSAPQVQSYPLRSFETANKLHTSNKISLTKYPIISRPVLTKHVFGELNAASLRMENLQWFEKGVFDVNKELQGIYENCFRDDAKSIISNYTPITYNTRWTREWLAHRPGYTEIDKELEKMEAEGLTMHDLNKVNVHQKLESLTKQTKPINRFIEQIVRIIVWQAKTIAAIFAPIFLEAKRRLKELLKQNIIYADGLRPDELSEYLKQIPDDDYYYIEDDGDKQDKRTTWRVLNVEMGIYKNFLKVDENVVSLWTKCHWLWKYKGQYLRGMSDGMRQTGQATTAIGNVLTNLTVHWRMWRDLGKDHVTSLVLGDDNIIIAKRPVDVQSHLSFSKKHFNMVQVVEQSKCGGKFLRMVISGNGDHLQCGPDYVRLRNRFEYTNGQPHEWDLNEVLEARAKSYLMMFGKNKETVEINLNKKWDLPLKYYHDESTTIAATAALYGCTRDAVLTDRARLLNYIKDPTPYRHQWEHWTYRP